MRVTKLTVAALAVVAGLSLTACENGEDIAADPKPVASSPPRPPQEAAATRTRARRARPPGPAATRTARWTTAAPSR